MKNKNKISLCNYNKALKIMTCKRILIDSTKLIRSDIKLVFGNILYPYIL